MREKIRARSAVLALALAAVLLTLCGCGGSSGPPAASAGGAGPAQSSGDGSSDASASSGNSAGDDSGSSGFGWVPFGPSDPGDPPPNRWYGPLADHDCSGLTQALADEPGGSLWEALGAVCAAAIDGDASQWGVAAAKAAAARSETAPGATDSLTKCLDDAASALLTRALAWHADHPERRPSVTLPRTGQPTACPFRIASVRLADAAGNPIAGELRGPVSGGTRLVVSGQGLGNTPTVLVAGHRATLISAAGSGGAVVVATPSVSHPLVGRIRVGNEAGQLLATVDFTYVATGNPS